MVVQKNKQYIGSTARYRPANSINKNGIQEMVRVSWMGYSDWMA